MATKTVTHRTRTAPYAASAKKRRKTSKPAPTQSEALKPAEPTLTERVAEAWNTLEKLRQSLDLTTIDGSKAHGFDFDRRKALAQDYYREEFSVCTEHLDRMSEALVELLAMAHREQSDALHPIGVIATGLDYFRAFIPTRSEETEVES